MTVNNTVVASLLVLLLAGCQGSTEFPEDQRIEGPFEIGPEWQTVTFEKPLELNKEGDQQLHIVVDENLFTSNSDHEAVTRETYFYLRNSAGVLIEVDMVAVGDNNELVPLTPSSTVALYTGGLTIGFGMFEDESSPPPPFPADIEYLKAVHIRSEVPFSAEYLRWSVDHHPDYHRCGYRRCPWWVDLLPE